MPPKPDKPKKPKTKSKAGKPDASEYAHLNAYLRQNRPSHIPANEWAALIREKIGPPGQAKNRGQAALDLAQWMKDWS